MHAEHASIGFLCLERGGACLCGKPYQPVLTMGCTSHDYCVLISFHQVIIEQQEVN